MQPDGETISVTRPNSGGIGRDRLRVSLAEGTVGIPATQLLDAGESALRRIVAVHWRTQESAMMMPSAGGRGLVVLVVDEVGLQSRGSSRTARNSGLPPDTSQRPRSHTCRVFPRLR